MIGLSSARTLSLDKILYSQGLAFGVVRHSRQVVQANFVQSVDALIVQTASNQEMAEICRAVRKMADPQDYLKPVFMVSNPVLKPSWKHEVDGLAQLDDLATVTAISRDIHRNTAQVSALQHPPQTFEAEVLVKLLQFLHTRSRDLVPFPNRYSKIHFQFPFISHFFEENEEHRVLHVLKLAERNGWLTGRVAEKIHLCPACGSTHQTLRSTCPKCRSVDVKEEDLVHHFPCAHIAPISDFERQGNDGLHCPKCDKSLRHIGNDYDKPASISQCNTCQHAFQQPVFKSLCVDCGTDNDLHALEEWDIKQMQLSARGKSIVLNGTGYGMAPLSAAKTPIAPGIYSFDIFKILLQQEMTARRANPRPGVLGQVKLNGMLLDQIPVRTRDEMTLEVCQIIKSYLQPQDIVSANGAGAYYFLLMESNLPDAQYLQELLNFNLTQLLQSNFKGRKMEVSVKLEPILR